MDTFVDKNSLRRSIIDDMFKDLSSSRLRWVRAILEPLVYPAVNRFARIAALFDQYVAQCGFQQAMQGILPLFVKGVEVDGAERIPKQGPLMVVSNHPGTYDSVAIAASLPRDDLNIIATGYPLLRRLSAARDHFIFAEDNAHVRAGVVRNAMRHLQSGGALLVFPSGRVEPDPAVLPGALEALRNWSSSLSLLLRKVPDTQVVVTIVSGVMSPIFLQNPLIRLWKGVRDPKTVAEVLQVITQMIFPRWNKHIPCISFDRPLTIDDLREIEAEITAAIIEHAGKLLRAHIKYFHAPEAAIPTSVKA